MGQEWLGAGNGSRTRVLTLGRSHNSRYTIPASEEYDKLELIICLYVLFGLCEFCG